MEMTIFPSVAGEGEHMLLRPCVYRLLRRFSLPADFPVAAVEAKQIQILLRIWTSNKDGVIPNGRGGAAVFWHGRAPVMFSVLLQLVGRFLAVVVPLKFGPRHCAQFSAERFNEKASKQRADQCSAVHVCSLWVCPSQRKVSRSADPLAIDHGTDGTRQIVDQKVMHMAGFAAEFTAIKSPKAPLRISPICRFKPRARAPFNVAIFRMAFGGTPGLAVKQRISANMLTRAAGASTYEH